MREIVGHQPCQGAGLMIPDEDPLWYDREEPDEAPGLTVRILIATMVAIEIVIMLTTAISRTLRIGVVSAFRDVKP